MATLAAAGIAMGQLTVEVKVHVKVSLSEDLVGCDNTIRHLFGLCGTLASQNCES